MVLQSPASAHSHRRNVSDHYRVARTTTTSSPPPVDQPTTRAATSGRTRGRSLPLAAPLAHSPAPPPNYSPHGQRIVQEIAGTPGTSRHFTGGGRVLNGDHRRGGVGGALAGNRSHPTSRVHLAKHMAAGVTACTAHIKPRWCSGSAPVSRPTSPASSSRPLSVHRCPHAWVRPKSPKKTLSSLVLPLLVLCQASGGRSCHNGLQGLTKASELGEQPASG